jgi:hypothetical protein
VRTAVGSDAERAMLHGVAFHDQTEAGVRVVAIGAEACTLHLDDVEFEHMPIAIDVDDRSNPGMCMTMCMNNHFHKVDLCVRVFGAGEGDMSMVEMFRSSMDACGKLVELRRAPESTREWMIRVVHGSFASLDDLVDLQGNANGVTMFHHHHADFAAPADKKVLRTWPKEGRFDLHGSEMTFDGNIEIAGNRLTRRLWSWNNTYRNGTVVYDNDGVPPDLVWNKFENCTITAVDTNRTAFTLESCELYNTTVNGISRSGVITLHNCFMPSGSVQGNVTVNTPAPANWLARTWVTDPEPQIGTFVELQAAIPLRMAAAWHLSCTDPRPVTTNVPFRFYFDTTMVIAIPGLYTFNSIVRLPLPADAAIAGTDFYFQAAVIPVGGQSYVPPLSLPRGARVVPKM